jgi:hypothetical protein
MIRASLAVCALLAAAPNCTDLYSLSTHGFTPPTVDMTTATAAPDVDGLRVNVSLTALNPNPYPITVAGIDYTVSVNGSTVFSGNQPAISVAEGGGRNTVILSGVLPTLQSHGLTPGQTVTYIISGSAHVDSPAGLPIDVDFSDQGTFVVPQGVP